MNPGPGSLWPLRVLGDPKWLKNHATTWNGHLRQPVNVLRSVWYDWHVASYLYGLVRKYRPEIVVETGVHVGKSTTAILSALRRNGLGKLYSIDLPKKELWTDADGFVDTSTVPTNGHVGILVPNELRWRWHLVRGDAREELPKLLDGIEIDFFLHDSAHDYETQRFEYEWAWAHLRPGGVVVSDDTDRSKAWWEFLTRHGTEIGAVEEGPGTIQSARRVR